VVKRAGTTVRCRDIQVTERRRRWLLNFDRSAIRDRSSSRVACAMATKWWFQPGPIQRLKLPGFPLSARRRIRRQTEAVPLKPGQTFSFNTFGTEYPQGRRGGERQSRKPGNA